MSHLRSRWESGRLWSLLEVLNISARSYTKAVDLLAQFVMVPVLDKEKIRTIKRMSEDEAINSWAPFNELSAHLEALGLELTLTELNRVQYSVHMSMEESVRLLASVRTRLYDEIGATFFIVLNKQNSDLYRDPWGVFAPSVFEKFPDSAEDLEEGVRCLSLHRTTACVFHLMRAMESAVQALGVNLDVENVDKEWGKILSDMHQKIGKMPKGEKRDEWSQVHANLYHVKQASRNKTMHPKRTYTEDQATEVMRSVSSFLRHLSGLL